MQLRAQVALFVEKGGETFLAHWIEYPLGAGTRTYLAVMAYEPTLFPRDKVGLALREWQYDVERAAVRSCLAAMGYRIVGELDADP